MTSIKAAIFDLDGTLVEFNLDYKSIRGDVRGYLLHLGIPPSLLSSKDTIFESLKKAEIFSLNSSKSSDSLIEMRKGVLAIADKYELEAARSTDLLPGVRETLKNLKNLNLRIGLFTLSGDKSVNYLLKRFKLENFFSVTVPRNQVNYVKPNPEHLETALKVLDVTPKETIVIGDGIMDMKTANELNATAIGLTTGTSTGEQLTKHGANYIITSITDLIPLIEIINKNLETA
jgi:HAD superfamily hydrolase (TIGR01509 family)